MKKILFAASESVPFIKTGGLADVVGSLPKYFDKEKYDVRVILPKYASKVYVHERRMERKTSVSYSFLYGLELEKTVCWRS